MDDPHNKLILALSERLYICSRLLTRAAERLDWDDERVRELIRSLDASVKEGCDRMHSILEV